MRNKSLLFRTRMYASHGSFEVYDVGRGRFADDIDYTDGNVASGFFQTQSRVWYATGSQLWDHRLDVWSADHFEDDPRASRVLCHGLEITDAAVGIGAFDMEWTVVAGASWLAVYVLAYNIGVELPYDHPELEDDEFLARTDLARFEIQMVRARPQIEGIIRGSKSLWPSGGAI